MLLTLTASCLRSLFAPTGRAKARMDLTDLPSYTFETLGLAGLNLSTDLLAGADRSRLERLRERGDKAGCSCLLLSEAEPQPFGSSDEAVVKAAQTRMIRVLEAAQILGCSSASVKVEASDSDLAMLKTPPRLKPVVERAEKLDINLLISPHTGLTSSPDRVADVIKRVGGFRIGTFPDFQAASQQKDPIVYLRRLTPYATAVCAATVKFTGLKGGASPEELPEEALHEGYDLSRMVDAIASVGYDGTLAIDYRGPGDSTMGVIYSRNALQAAIGGREEADLLDDELDGGIIEAEDEE